MYECLIYKIPRHVVYWYASMTSSLIYENELLYGFPATSIKDNNPEKLGSKL